MPVELVGIRRYPVKSCRGEELTEGTVQAWGLAGDRRWMVVGADGTALTARKFPRLVLVRAEPGPDRIVLRAPGLADLTVGCPAGPVEPVRVFGAQFPAVPAAEQAHLWFSQLLGVTARLMYQHDPRQRRPDPDFTLPSDRVSLADGYPLLLATTESLTAVNTLIAAGPHAAEGPVTMTRFRPNLLVRGAPAWAEDGWRRIRVGEGVFRAVKGCDRCVLTTVDPDTAATGREPLATLARHRRFDGQPWFGMNLVPDTPGAVLRVGDPVEVLDAADPAAGPPR